MRELEHSVTVSYSAQLSKPVIVIFAIARSKFLPISRSSKLGHACRVEPCQSHREQLLIIPIHRKSSGILYSDWTTFMILPKLKCESERWLRLVDNLVMLLEQSLIDWNSQFASMTHFVTNEKLDVFTKRLVLILILLLSGN